MANDDHPRAAEVEQLKNGLVEHLDSLKDMSQNYQAKLDESLLARQVNKLSYHTRSHPHNMYAGFSEILALLRFVRKRTLFSEPPSCNLCACAIWMVPYGH